MEVKMYKLDFLFFSPNKGDLPFSPYGSIYASSYARGRQGEILLSADCVTKGEVDEQIDRLIKQLEGIRKKAKRKFSH